MIISGLQRLTLLDYPGKVACTVFLGGCNFRCPFCHNIELAIDPGGYGALDESELISFLQKRRGVLDGVCVSGGEPLLTDGALTLMEKIKSMGYFVKLDTNGAFPGRLRSAVERGLVDTVAMDLKNAPDKYAMTAGVPALDLAPIRQSVAYLLSGAVDCEFRTTVVREYHDRNDFIAIGEWLTGAQRYFLQGFVDRDTVQTKGLHAYTKKELEDFADLLRPKIKQVAVRGE